MESKEQNLASHLNSLCEFLADTFNANCGGCCFVASVIAYCLEQDNIEYRIGVCSNSGRSFEDFYDIGCDSQNHYFIIVDNVPINDEDEDNYQIFDDVCAKDLFEHYQECYWNELYNKNNNDFIEHAIKEFYVKFYEKIFERESDCICF